MLSLLFSCVAVATVATAQSSNRTVDLLIPGDNPDNALAASVISVASGAAVYQVGCASGAIQPSATANRMKRQASSPMPESASARPSREDGGDDSCGFPTSLTITQGPSTLQFGYSLDNASLAVNCQLSSSGGVLAQAICTGTQSGLGYDANTDGNGVQTATLNGTDLPQAVPVRITAGADKLASLTTSSGSTSTSKSSSATSRSGSGSGTITSAPTGGSQTGSAPASTTSGAGARIAPSVFKMALFVLSTGMALFLL